MTHGMSDSCGGSMLAGNGTINASEENMEGTLNYKRRLRGDKQPCSMRNSTESCTPRYTMSL